MIASDLEQVVPAAEGAGTIVGPPPSGGGADRLRSHVGLTVGLVWAGACMLWLSPTSRAQASPPRVALSWRVPADAGCATRAQIEARLARITTRRFTRAGDVHSHEIHAEISPRRAGGFGARVVLLDAGGKRLGTREVRHRSPSCRVLDVSVGVIIATLLDQVQSPAAPIRADGDRLALAGYAAVGMATVSHPFVGAGIELGLPLPLPVVLSALGYLPADIVDGQGRGARLWSLQAGLGLCPDLVDDAVRLQLCVAGHAGGLWASGVGLTDSAAAIRPLASAEVEPKLILPVSRAVSARLSLSAVWMLARPEIHWEIEGEGIRTASAAPFLLILRLGIIGMVP